MPILNLTSPNGRALPAIKVKGGTMLRACQDHMSDLLCARAIIFKLEIGAAVRVVKGEIHASIQNGGAGKTVRAIAIYMAMGCTVIEADHGTGAAVIVILPIGASQATIETVAIVADWEAHMGAARPTMFTLGLRDDKDRLIKYSMATLAARFGVANVQATQAIAKLAIAAGMWSVERADPARLTPFYAGGRGRCFSESLETAVKWGSCSILGERSITLAEIVAAPEGLMFARGCAAMLRDLGWVPGHGEYDYLLG
jgi:hypothetical protein